MSLVKLYIYGFTPTHSYRYSGIAHLILIVILTDYPPIQIVAVSTRLPIQVPTHTYSSSELNHPCTHTRKIVLTYLPTHTYGQWY